MSTPFDQTAPARRGPTRPVVAACVAALLAIVAAVPWGGVAGAQEPDATAAAGHAAAWLATQVEAGLPLENFGSGDWGATLDAGLAFAGLGAGGTALDAIWAAVVGAREDVVAPFGADSPGRLAKFVLLARAIGEDPRSVGTGPGADLVARLGDLVQDAGPDAGLFGTADPTYDGAYRQGLSLVALRAVGAPVDPASVAWLEAQQCADGSWMPYRSDPSVPCAFDPVTFVGPDSNSTALALSGLVAASPSSPSLPAARTWIEANRNDDGGWGFFPGDPTDPNSTALVIQALLGDGRTSEADAALPALLAFQLLCDAPEDERGAFTFPGTNEAPSLLATTQAVPAAAGARFDHVADDVAPDVEPLDCRTPSTTSTTTPLVDPVAPGGTLPTAPGPGDGGPVTVGHAPAPAAELAFTGPAGGGLALTGALAVLAGIVLVARARRLR